MIRFQPRSFRALLLVAAAMSGGSPASVRADIIVVPVASRAEMQVSSHLNPTHPEGMSNSDVRAQASSLNPLTSSASISISNGEGDTTSSRGSNAISWTNSAAGTVSFHDVGVQAYMDSGWSGSASYTSVVRYSFQGEDAAANLSISYATSGSSNSSYGFAIRPYRLIGEVLDYDYGGIADVSLNTSGTYEYQFATLAIGNGYDGYGFEIEIYDAVSFGLGSHLTAASGSFEFTVSSASVPEPSSAFLVGVAGVLGWALRKRKCP